MILQHVVGDAALVANDRIERFSSPLLVEVVAVVVVVVVVILIIISGLMLF